MESFTKELYKHSVERPWVNPSGRPFLKATPVPCKLIQHSGYWEKVSLLGGNMSNDNIDRNSQSEATNSRESTTSAVPMHIGRNTVRIDSAALKHLIDTIRTRLYSEAKASN